MVASARRSAASAPEPFVILKQEEGFFLVYRPSDPRGAGTVSGTQDEPICTCDPFVDAEDPSFICEHIEAVRPDLDPPPPPPAPPARSAPALRAVSPPSPAPGPAPSAAADTLPAFMLLKRSVSPDGRIDSLSIEFTIPVGAMEPGDVSAKAEAGLALQDAVATSFLSKAAPRSAAPKADKPTARAARPKSASQAAAKKAPAPVPVPGNASHGVVRYVGTAKSPFGVNYTLSVEIGGERYRYFGSQKKVHGVLVSLGSTIEQEDVVDGLRLDLPCRATLVDTPSGYTNVEAIFPPDDDAPAF